MNKALVLRTCNSELKSYGGFQWPSNGPVRCPDWDPEPECGHGFHGALWGEGTGSLFNWDPDAKWLVVEVDSDTLVDLGGKVKFPKGTVVFCGNQQEATKYLQEHGGQGRAIIGGTSISGYKGTSTSGDYGTSTSGVGGTSTSGVGGTSTSGFKGTSTSGDYGTSTSGDYGTSTSGFKGTSTSGFKGTSTSGFKGTSTSGDYGTSTSGDCGTSTSGDCGTIHIKYWDYSAKRFRLKTGYIGENGLLPNVPYILDENNNFKSKE